MPGIVLVQMARSHNHIAASFSSGLLSIWDLSTISPLLRKEGRVVLPWQT